MLATSGKTSRLFKAPGLVREVGSEGPKNSKMTPEENAAISTLDRDHLFITNIKTQTSVFFKISP